MTNDAVTTDPAPNDAVTVEVRFRVASPDDVPAVVDLVESAYRGERSKIGWTTEASILGGQRTDADAVAGVIASPTAALVLAIDDDETLIGCCVVERRDAGIVYFGTFAVRPQLQAAGVGKRLLAEAERTAYADWSCHTIEMTVIAQREDLITWYVRRGYAPTGETRPFPYGDERFGRPLRDDLYFVVLAKSLD